MYRSFLSISVFDVFYEGKCFLNVDWLRGCAERGNEETFIIVIDATLYLLSKWLLSVFVFGLLRLSFVKNISIKSAEIQDTNMGRGTNLRFL